MDCSGHFLTDFALVPPALPLHTPYTHPAPPAADAHTASGDGGVGSDAPSAAVASAGVRASGSSEPEGEGEPEGGWEGGRGGEEGEHPLWGRGVLARAHAEVAGAQRGGSCTSEHAIVVGYHPVCLLA